MIKESECYTSLEAIEQNVQAGMDLSAHPIDPLYQVLKTLPAELVSGVLDKLSKEQRESFLDLDLWQKDQLDLDSFTYWLQVYIHSTNEEIKQEFVTSDHFALFLKGRVNIWTFDAEDPNYPEHDCFFLTEDNLLLVEFDENFEYVNELRSLIKDLYTHLGVEAAYSYLFKILSDSFLQMQEQEYKFKKDRLADYGFVDYYDALLTENTFPTIEQLGRFIKNKRPNTATIDDEGKRQTLHHKSLVAFTEMPKYLDTALSKVSTAPRQRYLQFNFIRLVNSTLASNNVLKDGPVAMTKVGRKTKNLMLLGFNYVDKLLSDLQGTAEVESIFDTFDFADLYKIGNSLVRFVHKKLNQSLKQTPFHDTKEYFLGTYINEFINSAFIYPIKYSSRTVNSDVEVVSFRDYQQWKKVGCCIADLLPFIHKFYLSLEELIKESKLMDSFYLNYNVEDIDFEAIILSSFANFNLGNYQDGKAQQKMGLTLDEFKLFSQKCLDKEGKIVNDKLLIESLTSFVAQFGLSEVEGIVEYLQVVLSEHLEGYEYDKLQVADFKHIGGAIILA
ncbi:MAG: hypothetical protein ISR65_14795 [Bacteriovoracaceae bacterium]|nr:hypothetical protein [Bacteriovoracaceae bacterium]